jgi:hypothetical protein
VPFSSLLLKSKHDELRDGEYKRALQRENKKLHSTSSVLKTKKIGEAKDKKQDEDAGWREANKMLQLKKRGGGGGGGGVTKRGKGAKEGGDSLRREKVPNTLHTGRKDLSGRKDSSTTATRGRSAVGSTLSVEKAADAASSNMSLDADSSEMAPIELLSSDDDEDEGQNENVSSPLTCDDTI